MGVKGQNSELTRCVPADDCMTESDSAADRGDSYDSDRFLSAQGGMYDRTLAELRDGLKRSH